MQKIDFRSLVIGFLLAMVFFLLTSQSSSVTRYSMDLEITPDTGNRIISILDSRTGTVRTFQEQSDIMWEKNFNDSE